MPWRRPVDLVVVSTIPRIRIMCHALAARVARVAASAVRTRTTKAGHP